MRQAPCVFGSIVIVFEEALDERVVDRCDDGAGCVRVVPASMEEFVAVCWIQSIHYCSAGRIAEGCSDRVYVTQALTEDCLDVLRACICRSFNVCTSPEDIVGSYLVES